MARPCRGTDPRSMIAAISPLTSQPGFPMPLTRVVALILLGSLLLPAASAAQARPALVVVIVVDQMRRDYIDDYGGKWRKGLRRLVDEGAWFTNAAYPY